MPIKVPQRKVGQTPTPDVRVGGGVTTPGAVESRALDITGKTISSVGGTLTRLKQIDQKEEARLEALRIKDQELQDRADATDAMTLYKGASNAKTTEYKAREGRNTDGLTLAFDVYHKDLYTKGLENLKTDRAKRLFTEDVRTFNLNARQGVMVHQRQEKIKSQKAAFNSSGDISVQNGIAEFDNPNTHAIEEDNIEIMGVNLQEVSGWVPDQTAAWIADKKSDMYEGIVRQWAVKDIDTAKLSYETNKDKILGDRRDDIETLLSQENVNQKSKEATDEIMLEFDNEKEALEAANKIKDADISEKTKSDIRTRYADQRRIDARDRVIVNDKITGDLDTMLQEEQPVESKMKSLVDGIKNGSDRAKHRAYYKAELKKLETDIETDDLKFTEHQQKITRGEYKSLAELRRAASPTTSKSDMTSLEKLYNEGGRLGGLKEEQIVKQYKLYTGKNPTDEKQAAQYQFTRRYIEGQVLALDRKLTHTDLSKWMAESLIQLQAEGEKLGGGFGYGADVNYGEALEQGIEVAKDWLPDITPAEINEISPILVREGIRPTEKNIRIYKKYEVLDIPLEGE